MAAAFSTSCKYTELTPNCEVKEIVLTTPRGANQDTVAVTLEDHGISKSGLLSVDGYVISTTYGVIITEPPTTSVSAGVLTITSLSGTGTKVYKISGKSN